QNPGGLHQRLLPVEVAGEAVDRIGGHEGDKSAKVDRLADVGTLAGVGVGHDQSSSPTSEREKARASKGCRSSTPSPTPISLIGASEAWATGTSTPPRAVPSSLVMTSPET